MLKSYSRYSLSTIDQAIWSLGNFALSVGMSKASSSAAQFAVFAVPLGLVLLASSFIGAFTHESLLMLDDHERWRYYRSGLILAGLGGCLFGVGLAVGLILLVPSMSLATAIWFGLACLMAAVVETMRGMMVLSSEMRPLIMFDSVWTVVTVVVVGLVAWTRRSPDLVLAGWVVSGAGSAALVLPALFRRETKPATIKTFVAHNFRAGRTFVMEYSMSNGVAQLMPLVVLSVAGAPQAGIFRSVQVAFGPVTTLNQAVQRVTLPTFRRRVAADRPVLAEALKLAGILVTVALTWGVSLYWIGPDRGAGLLGVTWLDAFGLVGMSALLRSAIASTLPPAAIVRSRSQFSLSLGIRLTTALLVVAATTFGATLSGASGAIWATLAVNVVMSVVWWSAATLGQPDESNLRASRV